MPATAPARAITATSGVPAVCPGRPRRAADRVVLASPKLGEREVVAALLDHERARLRPGLVILGDKGFAGREFDQFVTDHGARLLRPDRADEPRRHGSLGRFRQWIESTFQTLKGQLGLERHGGRTLAGIWAGLPSDCSPLPRGSGGTGRSVRPTSAPWSPTTIEPTAQSEAII